MLSRLIRVPRVRSISEQSNEHSDGELGNTSDSGQEAEIWAMKMVCGRKTIMYRLKFRFLLREAAPC